MNPFSDSQTGSKLSAIRRLAARPPVLVFALCLGLGLAFVLGLAHGRDKAAHTMAETEAQAQGAALELQFSHAITAAEVLGALARQSGGAIADFQKVATDLLAAHPGLAALELQPGGVVRDIMPRAGNERAFGVNVLKDPAQSPGASAAMQSRAPTVTGPVPLYPGGPGFVVRVPYFQRGRDGRDSFQGFVAVSMRQSRVLAGVDELWKKGYNYSFFLPGSAGRKPLALAARGSFFLNDAVLQPVRAQNLEFKLALKPRAGWGSRTRVVLECLGVLFASGLLFLFVSLLENRLAGEAALAEANQRVLRETGDRTHAEEDCRKAREEAAFAQAELKQTRVAREKAEAMAAELQARLEAAVRDATAAAEAGQAALQKAEQNVSALETRLQASVRANEETAQLKQAEGKEARGELQQAQQTIKELRARLVVAEPAVTRVAELSSLLEEALAELERQRHAPSSRAEVTPAEPPDLATVEARKSNGEEALVAPVESVAASGAAVAALVVAAEESSVAVLDEKPAPFPDDSDRVPLGGPSTLETVPASSTAPEKESLAAAPESTETPAEVPSVKPEPQAKEKPPKTAKRKKTRRDDQMDLFGGQPAAAPVPEEPAKEQESKKSVTEEPQPAAVKDAESAETSGAKESEQPAGNAAEGAGGLEVAEPPAPKRPTKEQPTKAKVENDSTSGVLAPDLPVVEGLSTTDGLAHAHGDSKLYLKALRHFTEQHAGTPETIRDALLQGDPAKAERTVQDLKAAAEEIGATAVPKAATALARAIQEQGDPAAMEALWSKLERLVCHLVADLKPALKEPEEKAPPSRRLPPPPPLDLPELRKAVHQILPLLADQDPGAKDCLKDNRTTFRSAFSAEGYVEFEQLVKSGEFGAALEHLKKAARKHGVSA